jgi:hypothetical protein
MAKWTTMQMGFADSDIEGFEDLSRVATHFGLPLAPPSRIYSRFLDERGSVPKPTKAMRRSGAFGHLYAFRAFAAGEPEIWIWNERYWFSEDPVPVACMATPQRAFREKFGVDRALRINKLANDLALLQTCKTGPGLPDLAIFAPANKVPWRFVEIKMPERGDEIESDSDQAKWLELLADVLGPECAIELQLVKAR